MTNEKGSSELPAKIEKYYHFPSVVNTSYASDLDEYPEGRRLNRKGYAVNKQAALAGKNSRYTQGC
jgi:hypothetical protein